MVEGLVLDTKRAARVRRAARRLAGPAKWHSRRGCKRVCTQSDSTPIPAASAANAGGFPQTSLSDVTRRSGFPAAPRLASGGAASRNSRSAQQSVANAWLPASTWNGRSSWAGNLALGFRTGNALKRPYRTGGDV